VANTVLVLQGCETAGCRVHSEGKPEGEVESKVLAGKLGGITSTLPGIKLFSQSEGKGGQFMDSEVCGGVVRMQLTGEVTGSLAGASGESAATGKLLTSLKLTFAEKGGIQKYKGFSEGSEAGLSLIATSKTVPSTWELGVTK
jgi:hypothetical protein